eukprot:jgi/Tetstr1/429261/TSEL_019179.t1
MVVVAAGKAGRRYVGVMKTSHGGYLKDYITPILAPMCAGDRLTLTATVDDLDLVAVGYNYNKKRVIHFLATKGAAPTLDGDDPYYKQRWLDEHGNLAYRDIPRPKLCNHFFAAAPKLDNHNHSRQFDLIKLEKSMTKHARCRICLDKHEECWTTSYCGTCNLDLCVPSKQCRR